jgi:restriction endonuclease Mrr
MAIPDFQTLMLPLLKAAVIRNDEGKMQDLAEIISAQFKLSESDMEELLPSGELRGRHINCRNYGDAISIVEISTP